MKLNLVSTRLSLAVAAGLAVSAIPSQAQNVNVRGTLSDVSLGGGVFDYTLTLQNTGPEAVSSLWFGWIPFEFNVANPSNAGNLQAWTSTIDGNSIEYAGTPGTAIAAGHPGIFTFDSTSTPAQFMAGTAGPSVAYGVNAQQFGLFGTTADSMQFTPEVVPEPSAFGLLVSSSLGLLGPLRRKFHG